jgi:tRNA(Ile)-lysidine synthase
MLPDSFNDLIREFHVADSDRLLVAVSGGLDSVVLLHLTNSLPNTCGLVHVNFKLRGQESDDDENFVRELATSAGISLFTKSTDTRSYATDKGISIQMAARELRYAFFDQVMESEKFDYLLMAHHLNDGIETALFNFVKGTGTAGLRGIPLQTGRILRPLMLTTRDEILHYALEHELGWREDSSNQDEKYHRNYLRHSIIPGLLKINPSLERTFLQTRKRLEAATMLIREEAIRRQERYRKEVGDAVYINKAAFADLNIAVTEELLRPFNCSMRQLEDLLEGIKQDSNSLMLECPNHKIVLDRTSIVITETSAPIQPMNISNEGGTWQHPLGVVHIYRSGTDEKIHRDKFAATFDLDKLNGALQIRKWEQGDRIRPLGMKGKKKVSDLMIDEKIPLNLKSRVCVLTCGDELVWVVGSRISDDFKVDSRTTSFLHIVIKHDQPI